MHYNKISRNVDNKTDVVSAITLVQTEISQQLLHGHLCLWSTLKDSSCPNPITDPFLDPLQFTCRANLSGDDTINLGLHFILRHLDMSKTYVMALFVDFSLAFNTSILNHVHGKL